LKILTIFIGCLFLISCSTIKLNGSMDFKNETYTSPSKEFVVNFPPLVHPNAADTSYPNQVFVDFFVGSGYWMPLGLHTIEWVKLPQKITVEQFQESLPSVIGEHVKNRFATNGKFTVIEQKQIPNQESHKFLAKGTYKGVSSTLICTIKWYKDRIAFISKILPDDNHAPIKALGVNTDGYNKWVQSFRVL